MMTAEVHASKREPSRTALADAERDRDAVADEHHPEAERDRDRHLLLDEVQHRDVAEIAAPEIEAGIVPQHQAEALIGRLVEAELLFQLLDEGGIQPLRAAIFRGRRVAGRGALLHAAEITAAAGDALRGGRALAGQLGDDALHRAARRELHHHEGDQHDADDGRHHERNAADDVGEHVFGRPPEETARWRVVATAST